MTEDQEFYSPQDHLPEEAPKPPYEFYLRRTPSRLVGHAIAYNSITAEIKVVDEYDSTKLGYMWETRYLDIKEDGQVIATSQDGRPLLKLSDKFLWLWLSKYGLEHVYKDFTIPTSYLQGKERVIGEKLF